MRRIHAAVAAVLILTIGPAVLAADAAAPGVDAAVAAPAKPAAEAPKPATAPAEPAAAESKPESAEAPEPDGVQTWWRALVYDVVFNAAVPILLPILLALAGYLLRRWGIKVKLETLEGIAASAARYAEQKGAEWLKENGEKSPGAKKEEWAWELVENLDRRLKGSERLRALILSKIPDAELKVAAAAAGKPAEPKAPSATEPA